MKTAKQIQTFLNFAQSYLGVHKDETKFAYALRRMQKRCEVVGLEHNEAIQDLNLKHCATSKDGVILKDAKGNYEFTKEEAGKLNIALRDLAKKEYAVEPYIATEPPPIPLDYEEREACYGFVLEEPKE
jgi:hypothetical protein